MKQKRTILPFAFALSLLASCGQAGPSSQDQSSSKEITSSMSEESTFSSKSTPGICEDYTGELYTSINSIDVSFRVDYNTFINGDNAVYSPEISKLGIVLASDAYGNCRVDLDDVPFKAVDDEDREAIYRNLHCEDIETIIAHGEEGAIDQDDTSLFIMSHRQIKIDGMKNEFIFLTVQGTNGKDEWRSNFDFGGGTNYFSLTGEHPEWKNLNEHKGFSIAASRALPSIEDYLERNIDQALKKTIFISGHSRGAGIANIIGAHFENDKNYKSFTYTFATPNVTVEQGTSYKTIFNILNKQDFVTDLPGKNQGFCRYGTDIYSDVEDYAEEYEDATNTSFVSFDVEKMSTKLTALAENRDAGYLLNPDDDSNILFPNEKKEFDNLAKATRQLNQFKNAVAEYSDPRLAKITMKEEDGLYVIDASCCPAFGLYALGCLVGNIKVFSIIGDLRRLSNMLTEKQWDLMSGIVSNVFGFACGHLQTTYCCVVDHIQ